MTMNVIPLKLKSTRKDSAALKNIATYEKLQRKLTLKEMQEKQYPFLNSDVLGIFDDLVDANLIELSEMKQSKEAGQIDDPKYCKYHRLIGYSIQDFFVFKDKVMQLARQGKISLEEDSATTNLMSIKYGYSDGKKASCNTTHVINEDGLLEKKDSSNANECMSTITFTDEDLLLGSKPHNLPLFMVGYAHEQKRKNDSSAIEVELSKGLTLPLTQINMKQLSKPPLEGFAHPNQEQEGGHEALAIDEK
ncbi:UNVERIFIED_CONTAM: hypothetical protein Sradi_1309700 [Sesamum radiatum]|uniref:Uncharacterized protein n=1 Tax=Sesamum radiatum TaxID=300843 RepID=A0AAW2UPZ7_SESRA